MTGLIFRYEKYLHYYWHEERKQTLQLVALNVEQDLILIQQAKISFRLQFNKAAFWLTGQ